MGVRELGPSMRPGVMISYPHMLREDSVVWTEFLRRGLAGVDEVWYDVHVGEPVRLAAGGPVELVADAAAVSRKRIDAVWRSGQELWVTEVKPYGGYVALGQVLVYWRLFQAEFRAGRSARPCVVCGTVDGDCVRDFAAHGVRVIDVGLGGPG